MRTVTIPNTSYPAWECVINGIKYAFPSGATMDVPDEVADLIGNNNDEIPEQGSQMLPNYVPDGGSNGQVLTRGATGYAWGDLPYVSNSGRAGVMSIGTGLTAAAGGKVSVKACTASALGGVKKGDAVADATEDDLLTQFNALLSVLRDAGVIASGALTGGNPDAE